MTIMDNNFYEFAKHTVVFACFGILLTIGFSEALTFGLWLAEQVSNGLVSRIKGFLSR